MELCDAMTSDGQALSVSCSSQAHGRKVNRVQVRQFDDPALCRDFKQQKPRWAPCSKTSSLS
ncbi:hypothetical protein FQJ88_05415 [Xanthomonas vasicola]|uniref:Uncharacterized protein n=1 Tax=Xanthomonas vasicola TaxID=56459 RepID=A0ABD7S9W5_XANVA|nr:hypothetical protein NX81_019385 [Xanthomonas vasicola]TWQ27016.1 hypothetical protein FQJ97_04225 [Xanthomonas vasicola]TWQ41367.1 hypothetical protein FQJ96_02855 [Xanthomonas vasicola]TWQ52937.1 hypothetical protein FQK01_11165 [Xanthomonas vasicola]TWQ53572.1 hypothetical protein FQJ94_14105 [Xanthomonas vasicola]